MVKHSGVSAPFPSRNKRFIIPQSRPFALDGSSWPGQITQEIVTGNPNLNIFYTQSTASWANVRSASADTRSPYADTQAYVEARRTSATLRRTSVNLMQFDMTGVPSGATIQSAYVQITQGSENGLVDITDADGTDPRIALVNIEFGATVAASDWPNWTTITPMSSPVTVTLEFNATVDIPGNAAMLAYLDTKKGTGTAYFGVHHPNLLSASEPPINSNWIVQYTSSAVNTAYRPRLFVTYTE